MKQVPSFGYRFCQQEWLVKPNLHMSMNKTWQPCPKTSAQAVDDASCQEIEQASTGANQAGAEGE